MVCLIVFGSYGSAEQRPDTKRDVLLNLSREFAEQLESRRTNLYYDLLNSKSPAQQRLNANEDIQLMFIDDRGHPAFFKTDNLNAAKTISTYNVWPGSGGPFSLDGTGTGVGQLCLWDGGGVRTTHTEFEGRVQQGDVPFQPSYHATHVAGTMIAAGIVVTAKGMSPAARLGAYDWDNDESEMAYSASFYMNVSNHSYSYVHGWDYSDGDWYWYGDPTISPIEDYQFGYYSVYARNWDAIAYNAPYYLIIKSGGNDRNDDGPGPGGGHYVYDGGWVWSSATRNPDGGTDGYGCVPMRAGCKNIMAVGSINDIPSGYTYPGDVQMSSYSAWGPTDDGRIKPDIVANGIGLYSCDNDHDDDYTTLGGTSMAAPSVAGSINSLIRYFENSHDGTTPLSSTTKAIVIHTADEAGANLGPDYVYGWGLMNTEKAAQLIQTDSLEGGHIVEDALSEGESDRHIISLSSSQPERLTMVWTDRPGQVPFESLNPPDLILVHDLDLRLVQRSTGTTYYPYILDPANPADAATTGDNFRDNIEQIRTSSLPAGIYDVMVSHKNSLISDQNYSLVSSLKMLTMSDFVCGNTNGDASVNIADAVYLTNQIFHNGPPPEPLVTGDVNCDGNVNIGDAVFLNNLVFVEGSPEPCADCLE